MRKLAHFSLPAVFLLVTASAGMAQVDAANQPVVAEPIRRAPPALTTANVLPGYRFPPALDRSSRKELENLRRVDEDDRVRYAPFLKGDNTGIFKLFPDNGCIAKNLIRVDGDCEGFVPDSSVYTFRTETYGRRVGDLGLLRGSFVRRLFFSQPIIVPLGDVPIEEVTDAHAAVRLLTDVQPKLTPATAEKASMVLAQGFEADGYPFASTWTASAGTTFLLRQIAFNVSGSVPKQKVRTRFGVSEIGLFKRALQYQERKDTVYAFRVVREDEEDGSLTIVWKQLSRKDAPAIVFEKGDKIPNLIWDTRPRAQ